MIEVTCADITTLDVEAVVNAANEQLAPGGGVCGAIYRAAGPDLQRFTDRLRPCATGEAVLTPGFGLKARYIIHAVGPVWRGGSNGEDNLLFSTYQSAFAIAREDRMKSIAFPAISTGIYGYPKEEAARIAIRAMRIHEHDFDRIIACVFDQDSVRLYERILEASPLDPPPVESIGHGVELLEPSSFEIAMMAKLKTMLPEKTFEHLERSRTALAVVEFLDPEVQKIWKAIEEDRQQIVKQAITDGTYEARRKESSS